MHKTMNISNISKILATKNTITISLTISIYLLFLVTNVKSDFSFNFPNFRPETTNQSIGFANDAVVKNGVVELTKKDKYGDPLKHSVGQFGAFAPIRIYDQITGELANFVTEFTFSVNPNGRTNHGDGFAFIIVSPNFKFPDEKKSGGGFLGMFTPETVSKTKQVLLVEFDSFSNEWDPNPLSQFSHIGIDVNSIKSVAVAPWFNDFEDVKVGKALIEYDASDKKLKVFVTYGKNGPSNRDTFLEYKIDLRTILPEWVSIGFSASTGDLVETHDILSWSFNSNI